MDTPKTITHISLCAGYGGIDLGLKRAIPTLPTIAFSEIEAFACANLVSKMEAGLLDAAPIWTNLKTFPWESFRDRVDIISGGYPCQPFSAAGKRLGKEDPRHLWPYIADGIRILRPKLCFFENVEGHISLGLRDVIEELGSLGYSATWGIFSASEVGAPHQRKRVFILAVSNSLGGAAGLPRSLAWNERFAGVADNGGGEGCYKLGDSSSEGHARPAWSSSECPQRQSIGYTSKSNGSIWPSRPGEPQHAWEPPRVVQSSRMADPKGIGHIGLKAECGSVTIGCVSQVAITNEKHTGEPIGLSSVVEPPRVVGNAASPRCPRPKDTEADCGDEGQGPWREESERAGLLGHTNSPLPQERQGQRGAGIQGTDADGGEDADRQAEPSLGRDADGPSGGLDYAELCVSRDNRTDELRLLGNGVVPATATLAFCTLMNQLTKNT